MFYRKVEARDTIALFCFLYLWSRFRCDSFRTIRVRHPEQRLIFFGLEILLELMIPRQEFLRKGFLGGNRLEL